MASSSGDISIRYNVPADGVPGPILATFAQGPPPPESLYAVGEDTHTHTAAAAATDARFPPLLFTYMAGDREHRNAGHRALRAHNGIVHYEAANFGDAAAAKPCQYLVCVYNRKRRRMDVHPVDGGCIFTMGMTSVRAPGRAHAGGEAGGAAGAAAADGLTARQRRDILIEAFGSRKKQKMEKSKQANIVDVAAVAAAEDVAVHLRDTSRAVAGDVAEGEAGEGAASAALGSTAARVEATMQASREFVLPPFNPHAAAPADAYPLDSLVPADAAAALRGMTEGIIEGIKAGDIDQLLRSYARGSEFIRERLRALAESGLKEKELKRKARCLAYLKCLVELSRAPAELSYQKPRPRPEASEEVGKESAAAQAGDESAAPADGSAAAAAPAPAPDAAALATMLEQAGEEGGASAEAASTTPIIPSLRFVPFGIIGHLLERFTERRADLRGRSVDGVVYVRPRELQDRLIAHICCLTLHVDNFDTNIKLIAADLKLAVIRMAHFFRELGCTLVPVRDLAMGAAAAEEPMDEDDAGPAKARKRSNIVSYTAKLNVPLTFPKLKVGRAKK